MRAEWSVADVCAMSAVPAVRYATERIEMLLANARTGGSPAGEPGEIMFYVFYAFLSFCVLGNNSIERCEEQIQMLPMNEWIDALEISHHTFTAN